MTSQAQELYDACVLSMQIIVLLVCVFVVALCISFLKMWFDGLL